MSASSGAAIDGQTGELADRLASDDIAGTLAAAVRARRTILVSGGSSTGKTTSSRAAP